MNLLSKAYNFDERGIQFLVMKSAVDDRESVNKVHSRALGDRDCWPIFKHDDIFELVKDYNEFPEHDVKWILVDECQFLTEEHIDQLAAVADVFGINVICYGLRTDFKTKLFPASKRLFEISDTIEEMKSTCDCGGKASVNARVDSEGNIVTDGEQVEVGGDDRYVAYCRKCFNEKINNEYYKV